MKPIHTTGNSLAMSQDDWILLIENRKELGLRTVEDAIKYVRKIRDEKWKK